MRWLLFLGAVLVALLAMVGWLFAKSSIHEAVAAVLFVVAAVLFVGAAIVSAIERGVAELRETMLASIDRADASDIRRAPEG